MVVHWRLIVRGGVWGLCPVAADHRKMYEGQFSEQYINVQVQNQRLSFVVVRVDDRGLGWSYSELGIKTESPQHTVQGILCVHGLKLVFLRVYI